MTYVNLALSKVHTSNKFYTYKTDLNIKLGDIVKVSFKNSFAWGVVISIVKKPTFIVKEIEKKSNLSLPDSSLKLLKWMIEFYPEDSGMITNLFLPANLNVKPRTSVQVTIIKGKDKKLPKATKEQLAAEKELSIKSINKYLLHGETGTGKTYVFIKKTKQLINNNKSVLILVPEIGLTPQLLEDLRKYLNCNIVLTHSELSPSERRRVWEYTATCNKPTVYVGPRSALFLPFNNLDMIVIDEAHDNSYKQNQSPRYNALNIAGKLAEINGSKIIQSTATPNVDDYEKAIANNYKIIRMHQQAAGKLSGSVSIIDITNRDNFISSPYLCEPLVNAIKQSLIDKQQSLLFLNRRGSARLIQCNNCGWQALCPNCGIPLIYHHDNFTVICHTCNYKISSFNTCKSCKSSDLLFKSIGTKSLVEHTKKLFPLANVVRFDADSTASEKYYKNIDNLKTGSADIIVGTQLITKGIDLKRLSVVGVINADSVINLPDFKAEETTFQQLYQVTGRAIRGHVLSKSFVQTRVPNHPVMIAVFNRSWRNFYNYELEKRRQYVYPPYCFIALIKVNRKSSKSAQNKCIEIFEKLQNKPGIITLGPSPSFYEKAAGIYCWQIFIKSKKRSNILDSIKNLPEDVTIDMDPISLL